MHGTIFTFAAPIWSDISAGNIYLVALSQISIFTGAVWHVGVSHFEVLKRNLKILSVLYYI